MGFYELPWRETASPLSIYLAFERLLIFGIGV
jgi:hypothetical protein